MDRVIVSGSFHCSVIEDVLYLRNAVKEFIRHCVSVILSYHMTVHYARVRKADMHTHDFRGHDTPFLHRLGTLHEQKSKVRSDP
jgi:hypothetical protein